MTINKSAIEQLQEEIQALSAKLEALVIAEQETPKKVVTVFDGWQPERGDTYHTVGVGDKDGTFQEVYTGERFDAISTSRCAVFRTQEQAKLVADAIFVMMELRNQPEAGEVSEGGGGWYTYVNAEGTMEVAAAWYGAAQASVCPCFPSLAALNTAIKNVGEERVERALRVMAMLPVEV